MGPDADIAAQARDFVPWFVALAVDERCRGLYRPPYGIEEWWDWRVTSLTLQAAWAKS